MLLDRMLMAQALGNFTTWNPADKGASCTLSNGNLTAYVPSGHGVRAIKPLTLDKYWEIYVDVTNGSEGLGIANASWPLSYYLGQDSNGCSVYGGGVRYIGGSNIGTVSAISITAGAVMRFAYRAAYGELYIGKDSSFYGDPVGRTSPAFSGLSGTFYPAIGAAAASGTFTANFGGSSWAYTCPSGFTGVGT